MTLFSSITTGRYGGRSENLRGAYVLYQYLQNLDGTGLASLSGAKSGGTHAPFAPPRPQSRRHCTSQSVAAAADLKPASRELGGATQWARATKNVKKPVSHVEKLDLRFL